MSSDKPPTHPADVVLGWSVIAVLIATPVTVTVALAGFSKPVIITVLVVNSFAGLPLLAVLLAGRGLPKGEQPSPREIVRSLVRLTVVVVSAFVLASAFGPVAVLVFGAAATWTWRLWAGGRRVVAVRQPASLKLPHHADETEMASARNS